MASTCCHVRQFQTSSPINNVQIACNEDFIAFPDDTSSISVNYHSSLPNEESLFSGHKQVVTALCFGNKPTPQLLGTGSEDCINVWYLEKDAGKCCRQTQCLTVAKNLGYVQHICFNQNDEIICVCVGNEVWLIHIETCDLYSVIEGHNGTVTASQFYCCHDNYLITISEDRTFQVWNCDRKSIIYHSSIISAHPFLSLALHPTHREVSIGSSDGMVRVHSLEDRFECIHTLDLNKMFARHQRNLSDENSDCEETGLAVNGLLYSRITTSPQNVSDGTSTSGEYHATSELLQEANILICGTTRAIFVINVNTCQLLNLFDFQDAMPVLKTVDANSEFSIVPLSASCMLFSDKTSGKIICVLGSLFEKSLHILHILLLSGHHHAEYEGNKKGLGNQINSEEQDIEANEHDENLLISVLSKAPLCEKSPLKAEMVPKQREKTTKKTEAKFGKKKMPGENQPVTFKSKIKSSGYTTSPRSKMFSPKINQPKQTKPKFDDKFSSLLEKSNKSSVKVECEEYNMPTELKDKISLAPTAVPINQISFSGDGKLIACALANQTAIVMNFPQTNKQRAFSGHNGAVQTVHFNHDAKLLLTTSKDNTAKIWSCATTEPLLSFTNQKQPPSPNIKDNPVFSKGITQALFYYVDKFVLLSSANTLYLYKYHLDFTKDDLKRYQSKSRYKVVTSLTLQCAQNISSCAGLNEFYSYIVICAGTDNSLEVFDMNVGRSLLTIPEVHTRGVHCIKMNQGSKRFSAPSQTYDLFLTMAITDGVKMWDLRTRRCVQRYEGHSNRSHAVGGAWSPCSRYFAVGSEDKSAYIYDVRQNKPLHRLKGHTDVVFDVDFHPSLSQLVTCCLDGKMHFYSDHK